MLVSELYDSHIMMLAFYISLFFLGALARVRNSMITPAPRQVGQIDAMILEPSSVYQETPVLPNRVGETQV